MHLIIVSGMLGVGKTSVVLKTAFPLSDAGKKVVIVENDFGSIGVDGDIIRKNGMEVRDLKGGCICCTLKTNLVEDLRDLQADFGPDYAIVEPTGIADPEYIIDSVEGVPGLTIDKVTTFVVVDAERFPKTYKMFERPLKNQFKVADLVLINKIDKVDGNVLRSIEATIRGMGYAGKVVDIQADEGIGTEEALKTVM